MGTPSINLRPRGLASMNTLIVRLQNYIDDKSQRGAERGASMAEYGLLIALVALVAIAAMTALGARLNELFGFASDTFAESPGGQLTNPTDGD